jgi:CBS domain-containing protein
VRHPETPEALSAALETLQAMTVSDFLKGQPSAPPPRLIDHDTPLHEILALLGEMDRLWVRQGGEDETPIGLITRRDVLASLMPPRPGYAGLRSSRFPSLARGTADCATCYIGTKRVPLCRPGEKVGGLIRRAVRNGETVVAVVEDGRFLGEVGVEHLISELLRLFDEAG